MEFVTLISSEANEIAEKEAKKTIATEHIDKALRELGFPEYVQEVLAVAGEHKEQLRVSTCVQVKNGCANTHVAQGETYDKDGTKWTHGRAALRTTAGALQVCNRQVHKYWVFVNHGGLRDGCLASMQKLAHGWCIHG